MATTFSREGQEMTSTLRRDGRPINTGRSPRAVWQTLGLQEAVIDGGLWAKRQAVNGELARLSRFAQI